MTEIPSSPSSASPGGRAKNIIFMVSDGMSSGTLAMTADFAANGRSRQAEQDFEQIKPFTRNTERFTLMNRVLDLDPDAGR